MRRRGGEPWRVGCDTDPGPGGRSVIARSRGADDLLGRAEQLVREAAQPFEDTRGSVDYKRHLAGVLFRRAFAVAMDRASGIQVPTLHV